MKKLNKKSYIFFTVLVLLGSLFLFFFFALNRVKIEETTRAYVETLANRTQGNIIFESSRLSLFPLPHLTIRNILFILPGNTRGTINSIEAYPKLFPLLFGRLKISRLKFNTPDININYAPKAVPLPSFETLKPIGIEGFERIKKFFPGIMIQISRGKIDVQSKDTGVLYLTEINTTVSLPAEKLRIVADCKSSLWQNAHISFWMDPITYQGAGNIDFNGFNIKGIPETLFPTPAKYISILSGDVHLTFSTLGLSEISGNTNGAISNMVILPADQAPLSVRCKSFSGSFEINSRILSFQMDKAVMTEPEAVLSGGYTRDNVSPQVTLEVTGRKVDIASIRKTALALLGNYATTQKIFDYVREGYISEVKFLGKAPSLKNFKDPGAIQLDSSITRGRVYIPKAELDLQDTQGQVSVYKGNLIGKNLSARFETTRGDNGVFSIGLHGPDAPFFLEMAVDADLAQLPPVLMRLIKNKAFLNEMGKVENFQGRATGKLILGDRKNAIRPVVDVSNYSLSADYDRTPLSISLTGKKFIYNRNRIELDQSSGTWGSSEFKGISAIFNWHNIPVPALQ